MKKLLQKRLWKNHKHPGAATGSVAEPIVACQTLPNVSLIDPLIVYAALMSEGF